LNFYDVDNHIPEPNPLSLIRFSFITEYNITGDFVVASDIDEFFKLIDIKAIVFNVESTNEWFQLKEDGPRIILREIDSYFDTNSIIPLSNRISSIG